MTIKQVVTVRRKNSQKTTMGVVQESTASGIVAEFADDCEMQAGEEVTIFLGGKFREATVGFHEPNAMGTYLLRLTFLTIVVDTISWL